MTDIVGKNQANIAESDCTARVWFPFDRGSTYVASSTSIGHLGNKESDTCHSYLFYLKAGEIRKTSKDLKNGENEKYLEYFVSVQYT